jgi:hypothetical protein
MRGVGAVRDMEGAERQHPGSTGCGDFVNMVTESSLTEESVWASGLAARLRLVQANFADDQADARQNYLSEEVERALKDVAPSRRKTYLEALAERFPGWEETRAVVIPDQKAGTAPLPPEALLARLIDLAPALPPETKAEFARQLEEAGLVVVKEKAKVEAVLDLPADLQKRLGIAAGQPLNVERAIKLLASAMELVLALDQLVWALWKQLAPKSNIRREADFGRLAGPYLGGDPEVSTQQVAQLLERSRRLIAGLLGAVGRAGSSYAKQHVTRFSPEVIEDWAKMEKKWSESIEQVCWRKYLQQAREYGTEAAIENQIQEAVAKAAENLIMGRAVM